MRGSLTDLRSSQPLSNSWVRNGHLRQLGLKNLSKKFAGDFWKSFPHSLVEFLEATPLLPFQVGHVPEEDASALDYQ